MANGILGGIGAVLGYASGEDTGDSLLNAGIVGAAGYGMQTFTSPVKVATIKAKDNRANFTFQQIKHQQKANTDIEFINEKLKRLDRSLNRLSETRKQNILHNLEVSGVAQKMGLNLTLLRQMEAKDVKVGLKNHIAGLKSSLADPDKFVIAEELIKTQAFADRITHATFEVGQKYKPRVGSFAIDGQIEDQLSKRFAQHHGMNPKEASRVAKQLSSFLGKGDFSNVFMTEFGIKFGKGRNERHLSIPFVEKMANGSDGALYLKSGGVTRTQVVPRFNPFGELYAKGSSFQLGQKMYGSTTLEMLRTGYMLPELLGFQNAIGKMESITDFDRNMDEMNKMRHYIAGNYDIKPGNPSTARARQVQNTIKLNNTLQLDREGNLRMRNMMPAEMADILTKAGNDDRTINLLANLPKSEVLGISSDVVDRNPLGTPFFEASRSELAFARDTFSVQKETAKPQWLVNNAEQHVQDFVKEQTFATKRIVTKAEEQFIAQMVGQGASFGDGQGLAFGQRSDAISQATTVQLKIPLAEDGQVNMLSDIANGRWNTIMSGEVLAQGENGPVQLGSQYSHAKIVDQRVVEKNLVLDAVAVADPVDSGYMKIFSSDSKLGLQVLTKESERKVQRLMVEMQAGRALVRNGNEIEYMGKQMSAKEFGELPFRSDDDFQYRASIFSNADNAGLEKYMSDVEQGNYDAARSTITKTIVSRQKAQSSMYMTMMNRLDEDDRVKAKFAVNNIIGQQPDVANASMATIEDLVNKTFQTDEDFKNIDVAYRVGHLQAITGAGGKSTGGVSRLHYKSLMESGFGADKEMAESIINKLTTTNAGALYEVDMLRQQVHPGQIDSQDGNAIRSILESDTENRLHQVAQFYGDDVASAAKDNNLLLNYNLSRDYNGLKQVSIPLVDTALSGLNEFGVDVPTMKSMDKARLDMILADIDANMEQNKELRKFKFEAAEEQAEHYATLLKNRFSGDGVAKQALGRKNKFGAIKTARIASGGFQEYVDQRLAAGMNDSVVGISKSQVSEYQREVAIQSDNAKRLVYEDDGQIQRLLLEDVKTGNKVPYQIHIAREPAQGIGSFGAFDVVHDQSLDSFGKAANLYFPENNPLARTGSMDVDGDILGVTHTASLSETERAYYSNAMEQNRALLDSQEIRAVGKGLGKGAKEKVQLLGTDYSSKEQYDMESFIEQRKARLHKIAAPDVTKVNFILSDALQRFGDDNEPRTKALANILNYQLTETMLKTKHMQNEQFLSMQKGQVEALEGALGEVNRTAGRDPYAVQRLRDTIQSSLLPDKERMMGIMNSSPEMFDNAVLMIANSYGQAASSRVLEDIGQMGDIARQKNVSELADSVLKYTTSQGNAGAQSGLKLDTSIARQANAAPMETAKNMFYQVSEIVNENIRRNKGIVGLTVAALAGSALLNRTQPTFQVDVEPTGTHSPSDTSARALPTSKGPQETLKPIQSQNAYVRKFSDKETVVNAKKSGELNKSFDQAYNGNDMGNVNILIKNG